MVDVASCQDQVFPGMRILDLVFVTTSFERTVAVSERCGIEGTVDI
jgi:hypothetical protein